MKPCQTLVMVMVCLVGESLAIGLPALFGSRRTEDKNKDSARDDELIEYQDNKHPPSTHKPTRPPLFPAIPHPADHPLHPHNNPNHPLHPDNLPTLPPLPHLPTLPPLPPLPQLPSLPHFTRETIHATKTVFVEVTDRVTIHPVCMTAYKVKPPCLPYNPDFLARDEEEKDQAVPLIQPTKAVELIEPTAAPQLIEASAPVENLEPTRILGGVSISESESVEPVEPSEPAEVEVEESAVDDARSARYMEITPAISPPEEVQIKDEPTETSGISPISMVQNLLHRSPVTHYKTKTLWVTKVEKVLDTRVTATLVVKNCIPTHSHIPLCAPHGGLFGPGYHGYHGEGTFTETIAGNFVSGTFTEKGQEDSHIHDLSEEPHSDEKDTVLQENTEVLDDTES